MGIIGIYISIGKNGSLWFIIHDLSWFKMIYLFTIMMFQSYVKIPERKKKQYQRTGYDGRQIECQVVC